MGENLGVKHLKFLQSCMLSNTGYRSGFCLVQCKDATQCKNTLSWTLQTLQHPADKHLLFS